MFGILSDLIDLIYPPSCLACSEVQAARACRALCESCWERAVIASVPKARNGTGVDSFDRSWSAWQYDGIMSAVIPAMKYRSHQSLAAIFSELGAQRIEQMVADDIQMPLVANDRVVLVPVPLHPRRKRERGFNQSELIARTLGRRWQIRIWPRVIRRTRYTQPQASLGAEAREKNVSDAFQPGREPSTKAEIAILVDDVMTTGATAKACARVLRQFDCKWIGVITLASASGSSQ